MIDPTPHEQAAIKSAGQVSGEFIESLGKTDLMTWSVEEFLTLVEVIVTAYLDAKVRLDAKDDSDDIPF